MENKFKALGINEEVFKALERQNIVNPTKVQEAVVPKALDGKSIIAQSETGTGKTLAYVLPIMNMIDCHSKDMEALILAPTHELVMQIHNTIIDLKKEAGIGCGAVSLAGSGNISRQIDKLKDKPQIATGSPGRVVDLIKRKKLRCHAVKMLVIDEFDRLIDKDNIEDVKTVIKALKRDVQIIMVSATADSKSIKCAEEMMDNPEIIKISSDALQINPNIEHEYFLCDARKKDEMLRKVIHWERGKKTLVFINNNFDVELVLKKLRFHNIKCNSICGNISKEERKKALDDFRSGKINVLLASDLGARGLDIKDISHVINFNVPKTDKDYVHRAGRAARGGRNGKCISLISPRELTDVKRYEKLFNIHIQEKIMYMGQIMNYEE